MIHRPSIVAGIVATLLAAQPSSGVAAPILLPGSPMTQLPSGSPAQGKVEEGLKALNADDLPAAEAAFTEAARVDPGLPAAYIGLAEVAGRQDKPAQVEYWLQKALSAEIADLRRRLEERQTVVRAVTLLAARGKSEAEAYAQLRQMAMAWRISFEDAAARIVAAQGGPDDRSERG